MDFSLDDLLSSDAANNAKAGTKFKPKAKPKPKPKPKTQLEPKPVPIPSTQVVDDVATANNEFTGGIEEEQPANDVSQISRNINDDWQSSVEKSQEENIESFLTLESLDGLLPQSTAPTVSSPPCSETPTIHGSMDVNLENGSVEPGLSNNIDACTNLESVPQLDPSTGKEGAIFNDNGNCQMGKLSPGSQDAESSLFWESLDILSQSNTCSGPRVGNKFKPKPKAQTRKVDQIAATPDQDVGFGQFGGNTSQTNYMENDHAPSFTPDEIDPSSIGVADLVPPETLSDFHVDGEPINFVEDSQVDSVIPEEHLDAAPEAPTAGSESVKKGKGIVRKGLSPTQQDKSSEASPENQVGTASERSRRRSNKTLEHIDEFEDEGIDDHFAHGNEDNNDGDYEPGNESLNESKGSKSKKFVNEKEKPVRKRKKASEAPVEPKVPKKKFSHRTRRNKRQVNPELLKIPEDELELHMHNVPMKELIRLAEHKEKMAKKEASTSGTPVINQSASSFSNHYDEDEIFGEGTSSAFEHDHSMEAENATYYNYRTHMKITPRMKWTKQDTELFYEAIQQFGTDLSMIKECFPGRTREQIKAKFKKEERQQPLRLNDALSTRFKGHSHFEVVIERLKQAAQAEESENDDQINPTDEEAAAAVAAANVNVDATKSEELEKEVKDTEAAVEAPTKSDDSEDEMFRWSQYKSEI